MRFLPILQEVKPTRKTRNQFVVFSRWRDTVREAHNALFERREEICVTLSSPLSEHDRISKTGGASCSDLHCGQRLGLVVRVRSENVKPQSRHWAGPLTIRSPCASIDLLTCVRWDSTCRWEIPRARESPPASHGRTRSRAIICCRSVASPLAIAHPPCTHIPWLR